MLKNPFLKRFNKVQSGDVLHSSVYARAQDGGTVGVASTESFAQRLDVSKNRQFVRRYGDSKIAKSYGENNVKAKILDSVERGSLRGNGEQEGSPVVDARTNRLAESKRKERFNEMKKERMAEARERVEFGQKSVNRNSDVTDVGRNGRPSMRKNAFFVPKLRRK